MRQPAPSLRAHLSLIDGPMRLRRGGERHYAGTF
jgi:hypothetical protein